MNPIGEQTSRDIIVQYLLKFPLRYCVPVMIGMPGEGTEDTLENASATLVTFPRGEQRIITNWHVTETYRNLHSKEPQALFQIGEAPFDPASRTIDEDRNSDLSVLDAVGVTFNRFGIDIPKLESYQIAEWPPQEVLVGDWVIFGGWPAKHRERGSTWNEVTQDSYSLAATDVTDSFPDRFHCRFDRSGWVTGAGSKKVERLQEKELSGLSGCPVLRVRHADGRDTIRPELVGFVMEYNPDLDKLVMTLGANIKSDSTLWHNTRR